MAYTLMCRLRGYMNKGVETDELRSGGALVLWSVARSERRRGESSSIEWTLWKVCGRVHDVRALYHLPLSLRCRAGSPHLEKCALGSLLGRCTRENVAEAARARKVAVERTGSSFFPIPAMPRCGLCYGSVASHS